MQNLYEVQSGKGVDILQLTNERGHLPSKQFRVATRSGKLQFIVKNAVKKQPV